MTPLQQEALHKGFVARSVPSEESINAHRTLAMFGLFT